MYSLVTTSFRGLITNQTDDMLPRGSLSACENIIISKKGELRSRKGFKKIISFENSRVVDSNTSVSRGSFFLDSEEILGVFAFLDQLLVWTITGVWITEGLSESFSSSVQAKKITDKTLKFPDDYLALKNTFYFLDNQILKKIINNDEKFYFSESCTLPQAYSPYSIEKVNDAKGVIGFRGSSAYRICYKRIYANGSTVSGAPSSRVEVFSDKIIEGESGEEVNTKRYNIRLLFNCPAYLRDEDIIEIYGSRSLTGTASDDMMLLYAEKFKNLKSNYSNNEFEFIDGPDYRFVPRYLYTSPSQEGIQNQNDSLPLCRHIALYRNMLAFLSPRYYKELMITIKKPSFLVPGDFFVFEKRSQIFKIYAANSDSSEGFVIANNDHRATVRNFVNSINISKKNTFIDAYDVSNDETLAIMLRARTVDDEQIKITFKSLSGQEAKVLDPDFSSPVFMYEGNYLNRILFSKPFFYEEIPFHRFIEVGDPQRLIIAACESKGYFYVFKEDGLFRVSGYDVDNLSVELVDEDVRLVSRNAIVSIDNIIYALTYRGLIRLSYDGVQFVSEEIENDIKDRMTWRNAPFCRLVKNPSENQVLLLCFSDETLEGLDTVFVYHHLHSEWTKWSINIQGAVYHDVIRSLFFYNKGCVYANNHSINSYDYVDELSKYCSASTLMEEAFSKLDLNRHQKNEIANVVDLIQLDSIFSELDQPLFFFYTSKNDNNKKVLWDLEGKAKGIFLILPNKARKNNLFFSGSFAIKRLDNNPQLTFVDKWSHGSFDYVCNSSNFFEIAAQLKIRYNDQKYSCAFFDFSKQIPSEELISAFKKENHRSFLGCSLHREIVFNREYTDKPLAKKKFSQLKLFFSNGGNKKMKISFKTDQGVSEVCPIKAFPENEGYGEGRFSLDIYGGEVYEGSTSNIFLPREARHGHYFSFSLSSDDFGEDLILSGSQLDFQS